MYKRSDNILSLGILTRNQQNLVQLTLIAGSTDFGQNLLHLLAKSPFELGNKSNINLGIITGHSTNSELVPFLDIIYNLLKGLGPFDQNSAPSVKVLWDCFQRTHQNDIVLFIPGHHWGHRLGEVKVVHRETAEEHLILLKGNS